MTTDTRSGFGELLRRSRVDAGLTQEELAERARVSARAVSDLERGVNAKPRFDTVRRLIQALHLSPEKQAEFERLAQGQAEPFRSALPAAVSLPVGNFLGALPTSPLVARAHEVAKVLQLVEVVQQGQGQLGLLVGEPGVGKTRLAQEVMRYLLDRGFLVATGRCYEPEQTVPYYPFLDALAMLYACAPEPMKREAAQCWPYLGALLPDQMPVPKADTGSGQDEQQRVLRAVTGFLELLAETQPLAILLDDLHWADAASLTLLLHLARHTRMLPLLLLGTYRNVEVGRHHPLEGALRDLQREGLMQRVEVRRLDQEGTAALVASTLGEETVSKEFGALMHGRTEGNPYFVQQVLRVLVERGDIFRKEGGWDRRAIDEIEVPESVRSVIGQRLSRLSDATQPVLLEASVLGQSFVFDDLLAITEHTERELEDALEEAMRAGLVRDLGHDAYSFDHALTQQSIYAELSSRRKRRLHLAAGEALANLPERQRAGRVVEIAWHFLQGDEAERALPWTLQAGDAAAVVFAHSDAEVQYRIAVGLSQDLGDEQRELDAWDRLGDVLDRAGRHGEAVEALEQATALAERSQDQGRYLELVARIGKAHSFGGKSAAGVERLEAVVREREVGRLDGTPSMHVADLYAALANLYFIGGRWQQVEPAAQMAMLQAEASGNERALCLAEITRGNWLVRANRLAEAHRPVAHATEIAERLDDPWLLAMALHHYGLASYLLGQPREGEDYTRRAISTAERAALLDLAVFSRSNLVAMVLDQGRWSEARREAERAVAESQPLGPRWTASYPLMMLGLVLLFQEEQGLGLRALHEALEMATRYDDLQGIVTAHTYLAHQEIREGRAADALAQIAPALQQFQGAGSPLYTHLFLATYAWAQVEAGSEERAVEAVAAAREQAEAGGYRRDLATVLLVSGKLAVRQRRWDDAVAEYEAGLALMREIGLPYDEALLLCDYGRLEVMQGKPDQGRSRLEAALAIFQRLGARLEIERTEQALAELGQA